MSTAHKPTRSELLAAAGKTVPDVIAPGLRVLFCGINPGLYSGAVGHHFARPGNRFWPTLYRAGFTRRLLAPHEERELLLDGYGITNLVARATATANELAAEELRAGGQELAYKAAALQPRILAILGVDAYRKAFARPRAAPGEQQEWLGSVRLWVLPNPSGLNAHYQLEALAALFCALRQAAEQI